MNRREINNHRRCTRLLTSFEARLRKTIKNVKKPSCDSVCNLPLVCSNFSRIFQRKEGVDYCNSLEWDARNWNSGMIFTNCVVVEHDYARPCTTCCNIRPFFFATRVYTSVLRTANKGKRCKKKKKKKRGRKRWSSNGTRGRLLLVAVSEFRILARVLYFECAYLSIFRTLFLLSSSPPLQTVLCICKSRPRTLMDISLRNEHAKLYFNSCDIFAWNVILRSLRNILA